MHFHPGFTTRMWHDAQVILIAYIVHAVFRLKKLNVQAELHVCTSSPNTRKKIHFCNKTNQLTFRHWRAIWYRYRRIWIGKDTTTWKNTRRTSTFRSKALLTSRRRAFARNVKVLLVFFRYSCIPSQSEAFFLLLYYLHWHWPLKILVQYLVRNTAAGFRFTAIQHSLSPQYSRW
jgi:hypothetical protein